MAEKIELDFDGDAQGALDALQLIINKQKKLIKQMKKGSKEAAADMKKDFGSAADGAVKDIAKMALQYVSVGAAVAAVTKLIQVQNEERKRGLEIGKQAENALGKLIQLGGGDVTRTKQLIENAKRISTRGGVSLERGANLEFVLGSLGLGAERDLFTDFFGIADPEQLASGVATLQKGLGVKETGGAKQVLSKLLRAAAVSKATVSQFAPAASQVAASARAAGIGDEELLATLAEISKPAKTIDIAATQLDAFLNVLIKKSITGKGIVGAAREIGAEGFFQAGPLQALVEKTAGQKAKISGRAAPELISTAAEREEAEAQFDFRRTQLGRRARPGETAKQKETRDLQLAEMERLHNRKIQKLLAVESESADKKNAFIVRRDSDLRAIDAKLRKDVEAIEQTPVGQAALKFFGEKEAFRGFINVQLQASQIEATTRLLEQEDIAALEGRGLATLQPAVRGKIPLLAELKETAKAKQRVNIQLLKKAPLEARREKAVLEVEERSLKRGEGPIKRFARGIQPALARKFGALPATIEELGERPFGGLAETGLALFPPTAAATLAVKAVRKLFGGQPPVRGVFDPKTGRRRSELVKEGTTAEEERAGPIPSVTNPPGTRTLQNSIDNLADKVDRNSDSTDTNTKGSPVPGAGADREP